MGRVLLTVVLPDVRWFEIHRVLDVVEDSTEGLEVIRIICKLRSASCIDDVPCVHYGIGYFFPVVPSVVVATWLRPRSLVCRWLATPYGDESLRLPGTPGSFDFADLAVVDDDGLQEYGLLEV